MGIIYITENLYNKAHGIMPWRYIGSEQYNKDNYLGSSIDLKKDIAALGAENFKKIILADLGDIDNKELRRIESIEYLQPNNVRADETYYNKTDKYAPGGARLGMKHTKVFKRTQAWKDSRRGYRHTDDAKASMALKKIGTTASKQTKQLMSAARSGENNPNALSWTITSPAGETFNVKGLAKWAKDNNYKYRDIYHNKNGWTAVKHGVGLGGRKKKDHISGI